MVATRRKMYESKIVTPLMKIYLEKSYGFNKFPSIDLLKFYASQLKWKIKSDFLTRCAILKTWFRSRRWSDPTKPCKTIVDHLLNRRFRNRNDQPLQSLLTPFKTTIDILTDPKKESLVLVVNKKQRRLEIIEGKTFNGRLHLDTYERVPKETYDQLGKAVRDKNYNADRDTHCHFCDKYYQRSCKIHPLMAIKNKKKGSGSTEARRSLPSGILELQPSTIPNAGVGVFSKVDLPTGIVFGPYEGELVFEENTHGCSWRIGDEPNSQFIDAVDESKSNWLRFVNSPRDVDVQNLFAFSMQQQIFYKVIVPIKDGEELFVFYGDDYAAELKADAERGNA